MARWGGVHVVGNGLRSMLADQAVPSYASPDAVCVALLAEELVPLQGPWEERGP